MTRSLVLAALGLALLSVACTEGGDRALPGAGNELRAPLPGANPGSPGGNINVAHGSVPDDSIKPKPTVNVTKVGPLTPVARGGIADDTIKPKQGQNPPATPSKPPR